MDFTFLYLCTQMFIFSYTFARPEAAALAFERHYGVRRIHLDRQRDTDFSWLFCVRKELLSYT
jgi:hypothetical protein